MKERRSMKAAKRYTVSDGKMVLCLEPAEEGGYVVTSPLDPELITEAETVEEAFANAQDAARALRQARVKLFRKLAAAAAGRGEGKGRE
jgi:predicted RNase H-like HicB family nuclease